MLFGGWQKFSTIDYPGKISAIVFTQGCPFRCAFCHNPELVEPDKFLEPVSEKEIMDFLAKRAKQLEALVITGGEPTLQKDLLRFISEVKEMGYLIKLDTNGNHPEVLNKVLKSGRVDYLAMDIKSPLSKYREVAGQRVRPESIRQSIDLVIGSGLPYEFRTTVVKEQLSKEDLLLIGQEINGAKKYVLQKFNPQKTLSPLFKTLTTYTDEEFTDLTGKLKDFVAECLWR